jgi:hypothetical protein
MKRLLCLLAIAAVAAAAPSSAAELTMLSKTPYAEDARIADKIIEECVELQGQLPAYTQEYAREHGIEVNLADSIDPQAGGRVLVVEITDAISRGNPFIGHQKSSEVEGTLWEGGAEVASFRGMRHSMGGFAAGYKGSCSVLGRTVKALGKDIAEWLKDPKDGAELGDE